MKAKHTHSLVRILFTVLMVISLTGFLNVSSVHANEITILPQETEGPFIHNVFHDAALCGGTCGSTLAWFDIDTFNPSNNFYNPDTNMFSLNVKIYNDSSFSTQIGAATGIGNLNDAKLAGSYTEDIAGTITWTFDFLPIISGLKTYVGNNNEITMTFLDYNYVTSVEGFTANTWQYNALTLWGADGTPKSDGSGEFYGQTLGVDLVALTDVYVSAISPPPIPTPEPSSLLLLGSSLVGLGFLRLRNKEA